MGYSRHFVDGIGSPFLTAHEQISLLPENGSLIVDNNVRKMLFMLQGDCRHRVLKAPGGDEGFTLAAGDIFIVPFHCNHEYRSLQPGAAARLQIVRIAFDPAAVPPLPLEDFPGHVAWADEAHNNLAEFVNHHFGALRHLPDGQNTPIREALGQLREEAQARPPGYRLRVYGLCVSLVTLVARQMTQASRGAPAQREPCGAHHVVAAKEYLLRHLDQPLRLGQVASHVRLSEPHLARLFKQVTGQTVFEYVRQMRFEKAKNYLSESDMNISEIARRTGFASLEVFSRTFKREVGISPSEYRRQVSVQFG